MLLAAFSYIFANSEYTKNQCVYIPREALEFVTQHASMGTKSLAQFLKIFFFIHSCFVNKLAKFLCNVETRGLCVSFPGMGKSFCFPLSANLTVQSRNLQGHASTNSSNHFLLFLS